MKLFIMDIIVMNVNKILFVDVDIIVHNVRIMIFVGNALEIRVINTNSLNVKQFNAETLLIV